VDRHGFGNWKQAREDTDCALAFEKVAAAAQVAARALGLNEFMRDCVQMVDKPSRKKKDKKGEQPADGADAAPEQTPAPDKGAATETAFPRDNDLLDRLELVLRNVNRAVMKPAGPAAARGGLRGACAHLQPKRELAADRTALSPAAAEEKALRRQQILFPSKRTVCMRDTACDAADVGVWPGRCRGHEDRSCSRGHGRVSAAAAVLRAATGS
jgi:hypothetical protein